MTRREVTHNRYFPDETALAVELDAYFAQFRGSNKKLSRLCSFKYKNNVVYYTIQEPGVSGGGDGSRLF